MGVSVVNKPTTVQASQKIYGMGRKYTVPKSIRGTWYTTSSSAKYKTVRIGEQIYILRGKDEKVMRTKSNPSYCSLSVNGIYFLNRGTKPYSMVLACAHL